MLALVAASTFTSVKAEDLIDIYQLALQNDPLLSQEEARLKSVSEQQRQVLANLFPSINASANYTDSSGNSTTADGSQFESDVQTESVRVTLDQTIYDHSDYTRLDSAKASTLQAEANLVAVRQDLMIRVAERYLAVLTNQDAFRFSEAELKANQRQLEQAEQRYEVGLTAITDVHEARASFDRSRANLIVAQNSLDDSFEALSEITAQYIDNLDPLQEEVTFSPPVPADPEAWVQQALSSNPSVQARKYAAEAQFHAIRTQRSGHFPSVAANATYSDRTNDGNLGPFATTNADDTSFGFTVSIPIYAGGAVSSQTRQARFDHEVAMQQLEQEQRTVTRLTRNNYRSVIAGISQVEAFSQSVVSATSALEATEAGFEVGTRTIVDVLQSQQSLFQAQRDYSQARHNLLLDELRLEASAGQIDEEDLNKINMILR